MVGFYKPILMHFFKFHIKKHMNGNTEKLENILEYHIKVFTLEEGGNVGVSMGLNALETDEATKR